MRAQRADAAVDLCAGCGDQARVSEGGEIFCGIEAERRSIAQRACGAGFRLAC